MIISSYMETGEILKIPQMKFTLRDAAEAIASSIEEVTGEKPILPQGRRASKIIAWYNRRGGSPQQQAKLVVQNYLKASLVEAKDNALHLAEEYWDPKQKGPHGGSDRRYDQSHMGAIFDELLKITGGAGSPVTGENMRRMGITREILDLAETRLFLDPSPQTTEN